MRRLRRWLNAPFWLGVLILLAVVGATWQAERLAVRDPRATLVTLFYAREGLTSPDGAEFMVPPYPPMRGFPLGSDRLGRDLWSRILYAPRITLPFILVAVTLRLLVGGLLGIGIGWLGGRWRTTFTAVTGLLSAIPPLILLLVTLSFMPKQSVLAFPLALLIVGWGGVAEWIANRLMIESRAQYIEAARAMGQTGWRILWRHAFPQVWPGLVVLIPLEMSAILLLMAEAGFLGYFIGGGYLEDLGGSYAWRSDIPEMGQLLADGRNYLFHSQWILVVPALAFLIPVIGLNLLGEGLRRILDPLTNPH